jgi:dienelactone hydrolase
MICDVITRTTTAADWPRMRREISGRIRDSMGTWPALGAFAGAHLVTRRYEAHGLRHEEIAFEVLPGYRCAGTVVRPPPAAEGRRPAVVSIHGTDRELARRNTISPDLRPDAAYAIELARRGYVAIAVDQFGFGEWVSELTEAELYARFARDHPGWSLDGIRLHIQQCAVGILAADPQVDGGRIACIGNSLGGRAVVYLAAFDERVRAAVVSTGVSGNTANVFRNLSADQREGLSPRLNAALLGNGRTPWEYEELLALIAPRALILLEPFNDLYNPSTEATVECFLKARRVYELLGAAADCTLVCHGRGHSTPPEMRGYAYALVDLALANRPG